MLSEAIKKDIEERFGSQIAYPKDCEALAEDISQKCSKRISSSTLKRLWGFHQSVNEPRIYTMDILANYLGYESWNIYLLQMESKGLIALAPSENIAQVKNKGRQKDLAIGVAIFILIIIVLSGYFLKYSFKKESANKNEPSTALITQKPDSSFLPENVAQIIKLAINKISKPSKVETKPVYDSCYTKLENMGKEYCPLFKEEIRKQNITDLFSTNKIQRQCYDTINNKGQRYIESLPKEIQDTCRFLFVVSMNKSHLEIMKVQLTMQ